MYQRVNVLNRHNYPRFVNSLSSGSNLLYWFLISVTVLFSITSHATSAINTSNVQQQPQLSNNAIDTTSSSELQTAQLAKSVAETLAASQSQEQLVAQLANSTSNLINRQGERWLGQFGQVRATLGIDQHFKKISGGLALLSPLDDHDPELLTFSQIGVHYYDRQPLANIGLGQRYSVNDWMLGYNAFFDYNIRHSHSRVGFGAEAWRDYLLLSSNGYFPISTWKDSNQLKSYQEKPAKGFDVRAKFYLPDHQQLGGSLTYEHYFGDKVALFGNDKLQKNPKTVAVGINYTPIPLLTLGVEHKRGNEKKHDSLLTLQLNYEPSIPWKHQLDTTRVAFKRSLEANRYSFVDRNERMVMQYQKTQDSNKLSVTPDIALRTVYLVGGEFKLTASGGTGPYTWKSAHPDRMTVDKASGLVTFKDNAYLGTTITVTDGSTPVRTFAFTVPDRPILRPIAGPLVTYAVAETRCADANGSMPSKKEILEALQYWKPALATNIFTNYEAQNAPKQVWARKKTPELTVAPTVNLVKDKTTGSYDVTDDALLDRASGYVMARFPKQ